MNEYRKFFVSKHEIREIAKPIIENVLDDLRSWHISDFLDAVISRSLTDCYLRMLQRHPNVCNIDREIKEKLFDPNLFEIVDVQVVNDGWDVTCIVKSEGG